jgi:hypothetical protein
MKKVKFLIFLPAFVFFFAIRGRAGASNGAALPVYLPSREVLAHMSEEQKQVLVQQMKDRVEYIRNLDRSALSGEERKALRTELRSMKRESRIVTGIYISVGALIIIILLLILII